MPSEAGGGRGLIGLGLDLPLSIACHGAVDGGAGDAEQVTGIGSGVLAAAQQGDHMGFLTWIQFRLLAPQMSLGLGDLHALAGAEPNQVGLELGDHRQHVEQQPADRIGRVIPSRPD